MAESRPQISIRPMPEAIKKMRAQKVQQAFELLREVGAVVDVVGSNNRSLIIVDETVVSTKNDGTVSIMMDGIDVSRHVGVCNVQFRHGHFPTLTLVLKPKMVKLNVPT
jgi:hypothetical protein